LVNCPAAACEGTGPDNTNQEDATTATPHTATIHTIRLDPRFDIFASKVGVYRGMPTIRIAPCCCSESAI
jgi:hypothetical protein